MKNNIYKIIAFALVIAFSSCKKNTENAFSDSSNFKTGSYLTLDSTFNSNFDYSQIATSTVGIYATQYGGSQSIDHLAIYVVNGASTDTTKWKFVKNIPYTTANTKVSVSGAELGTAFGVNPTTFTPGSNFTFYIRLITKTGKSYDVTNTGNSFLTGAYYNAAFSFGAYITCPFTGGMAGTYKVIEDDWVDWNPGDLVSVTDGPAANQINLSQIYPGAGAGGHLLNPLVVDIDPATGTASVHRVIIGSYGTSSTQYAVQGSGADDVAGYVFSCTGYITIKIDFTTASKSIVQQASVLTLQKQ